MVALTLGRRTLRTVFACWTVLAIGAVPCRAQESPGMPEPTVTTLPRITESAMRGKPEAFRVEEPEPGVLVFRPVDGTHHVNGLVFERTDGLLAVDAQPSPEAARDLLAAIRSRTSRPIRYLVFTHPHLDSYGGASAFPRDTLRIASRGFRDAMADLERDPAVESRLRRGYPAEDEPPVREQATLVLFGRTRLEDARHPIILLPAPHAHSTGDLLVYQPDASVVAAGDLAFADGRPFAGDARIGGWIGQIDLLRTMAPATVVPLRGPVVDAGRMKASRDAFEWIGEQVDEAFREQVPPDQIAARILGAEGLDRYFVRDPNSPFLGGLIERVIEEARERRRREGLE